MESQYKSQLKSIVLNLRHILEGRYDDAGEWHPGALEEQLAALGVRRDREAMPLAELPHLSEDERRSRHMVDAFIRSHSESGSGREEAIREFLQESAYTWANRLLALRCMEARGLIDEVILQKESYGGRSLKHNRLAHQDPAACTGEDDGLYAVLLTEFEERADELPLVFSPDEPVIALKPGVAALKKCIQLLSAPDEIFTAPDALGWAYQYWNTEEKDRVFAKVRTVKGTKIEKTDIIPVTQLYTEPYMVKFLVQNSLGALWMAMHPDSRLCDSWPYYVRDAGRSPVDRKPLTQISFLDPCVGSGHFLLEAFDLLYAMYEEDGELAAPEEICGAILSHNLYGIDIDERSVQIAGLALYLKAKEKAPDFRAKRINLVATNIHPTGDTDHLTAFLTKHPEDRPLKNALQLIFDSLRNVDELGTLLQVEEPVEREFRFLKAREDERPSESGVSTFLFKEFEKPEQQRLPLGVPSYEAWKDDLVQRLKAHFQEAFASADFSSRFFGETAEKGLSLFDFLSRRYDVVATNPPYMGSKNMGPVVKKHVEKHFKPGKRDLYAAFILRCLELARPETGRVAMVTQQSWMFLRSFADLRALDEEKLEKATGFTGILRETSIETLAHLGPGAFGEISGEVVNIALFTLAKKAPSDEHRLTAFRLIGPKSPEEKDRLLLEKAESVLSRPRQEQFISIPQTPVCYWLRERFFDLLAGGKLRDLAVLAEPTTTGANERFVRAFWEIPEGNRWISVSRGGGYSKWTGCKLWEMDWEFCGGRIKSLEGSYIRNEHLMFNEGLTYTESARGSLGIRFFEKGETFAKSGPGILPMISGLNSLAEILNCRVCSYFLRITARTFMFSVGSLKILPIPAKAVKDSMKYASTCLALKRYILAVDPTERGFKEISISLDSVKETVALYMEKNQATCAILHALEGLSEREVFKAYRIDGEDLRSVLDETGTPSGWFPLIQGYDALPDPPEGLPTIPKEVLSLLSNHERRTAEPDFMDLLKQRLRSLYEAGPGAKEEPGEADIDTEDSEDEENEEVAVGARIPIPAETFLEELSQKLEIHPISVYWLLKEGIEKEGWRCLPEERRITKDRYTVLILRLLGHRWPKQIEAGEPVPEWADEDGIIPLTGGTDESTLYARLRERLAVECGDAQVSTEENTFEEVIGKPLSEWVRKDFFRHHISQFKKRPIAWHLSSGRWNGRQRQEPAFECLVYFHKMDGDLLHNIRTQYVGPFIKHIDLELRGLENGSGNHLTSEQENRKILLRDRIPELKAFDNVLAEIVATGFGPESMKPQLRQVAVNDAVLCLKARWLKKLSSVIQEGPLADWKKQADRTGLHADFSAWISDAVTHLDHHCTVVGPVPPSEKDLDIDPTSKELAHMICEEAEAMMKGSLACACRVWWRLFDTHVLKPFREKIREAKKEQKALKEKSSDPKTAFKEQSDIKRKMKVLKSDIKAWQNASAAKSGQGQAIKDTMASWSCPEALTWESWLAGQEMYDPLSSLDAGREPPRTVQDFVRQESLYQPDINDGVRVNVAPLQLAGLLTANVLADKDMKQAIADRASWRDDERRWCREGKLPRPGWWE